MVRVKSWGFARNMREEKPFSADVTWEERQGPELGESLSDAEASTEHRTGP